MAVYLTDAPTDEIDALWIDLGRVDIVHTPAGGGDEIVTTVRDEAGRFDLLSLQNGVLAALGIVDLPAGHLSQIRLILTSAEVERDGALEPVAVPSGAQTGLKIDVDADLVLGRTYEVIVDFDAAKSLHYPPGRGWMLKPVLTAEVRDDGGAGIPPTADDLALQTTEMVAVQGALPATPGDAPIVEWALVDPPAAGALTLDGATGAFRYAPDPAFVGSDAFTWRAGDGAQWSNIATVTIEIATDPAAVVPPDPTLTAPALDTGVAADMMAGWSFLFEGPDAIQTGVAPGTITARRIAVLVGEVATLDGAPIAGARVDIPEYPEFGETRSRVDGKFELAVNGGGSYRVRIGRIGYSEAIRAVDTARREHFDVGRVVLARLSPVVTPVALAATTAQVALGEPVVDDDGARTAAIVIAPGTRAWLEFHDGTSAPIDTMQVRFTELTAGERGWQAIPAPFPAPIEPYYAFRVDIDEARLAGAEGVALDRPVALLVENFTGLEVGSILPFGRLDHGTGAWLSAADGRVVEVLGIDGAGLAILATDEPGVPADPTAYARFGISDDERRLIASRYAPGSELWRVTMDHFSDGDINHPGIRPPHNGFPPPPPPKPCGGSSCECGAGGGGGGGSSSGGSSSGGGGSSSGGSSSGDGSGSSSGSASASEIECPSGIFRDDIELVGTPYKLWYHSDWMPGYKVERLIEFELFPDMIYPTWISAHVNVQVAGQRHETYHFQNSPQTYSRVWNGRDHYGRPVLGKRTAKIEFLSHYRMPLYICKDEALDYLSEPLWEVTPAELDLMAQHCYEQGPRYPSIVRQTLDVEMRNLDARTKGFGGWNLDALHVFDPTAGEIYYGNGARSSVRIVGNLIRNAAQNPVGDIGFTKSMRFDGEGGIYTTGLAFLSYLAPGATSWQRLDSGFNPDFRGLALTADGSVLYSEAGSGDRIKRRRRDGVVEVVAGGNGHGYAGDFGPATAAKLADPSGVAIAADDTIYVADTENHRIRRIDARGTIRTIAGTGAQTYPVVGQPALATGLRRPFRIAVDAQGRVYFTLRDEDPGKVYVIDRDGTVQIHAGGGTAFPDEVEATQARFRRIADMVLLADGSMLIFDLDRQLGFQVNPDGRVQAVLGGGSEPAPGNNALRTRLDSDPQAQSLGFPAALAADPEGRLCYLMTSNLARPRCADRPYPGFSSSNLVVGDPHDDALAFVFDRQGRHLRTVDRRTGARLVEFFWQSYGATKFVTGAVDLDGNVTHFERDPAGHLTAVVGPFGHRTEIEVSPAGYMTTWRNPAGDEARWTYVGGGLLNTYTTPNGDQYGFEWDALGRIRRESDPAGGFVELVTVTRADGVEEVVKRSALGREEASRTELLPSGSVDFARTFASGVSSQSSARTSARTTTTLPDGSSTTRVGYPDPLFGLQSPLDAVTTRLPSGLARTERQTRLVALANPANPLSVMSQTDRREVNGRIWQTVWNASTRTRTSTTPEGRQTLEVLDAKGRVVERRVGTLEPVFMTYDDDGLLVEIRQGSGGSARVTTMDYDTFGRLSLVLDPIGRTTGFDYDPANRLTARTLPDANVVGLDYDANGNMIALTPPARPAHEFEYTPVNLESSYDPPNAGLAGDVTRQYYDLDRMLTQVDRPDGTLQYGYDAAGRLAAVTAPSHTVTYGYDVDTGQLVGVSSTDGIDLAFAYDGFLRTSATWSGLVAGSVAQTYDNSFRPIAETIQGAGLPHSVSFGWDDDDLLIAAGPVALSRRASDGLLASATVGAAVETYGYNAFGETTSRQSAWSGNNMYAATYTRDDLGRIATKTETVQGVTTTYAYGYDARGRLETVHTNGTLTATWGYDPNGNRVVQTTPAGTTVGLVDDQDRLLAWGAASYTYDANGDLTTRTDSAGVTSYDYDLFGNLRRVDLPSGDVVEYLVDGQNRRVGRVLNGAVTHKWLYKDQLNPVAELDAAGNVVSRFIYGTTYHAPDVMLKGGATYRLVTDHLGSVRLVVDVATGSVAQRLDYDEWGRVLVDTNPGFQPFGYAGGLYDPATGLVRFGARDYDAEVGRWTAKDPIRFAGGDENIYAYVGGDPVNLVDPSGMVWYGNWCGPGGGGPVVNCYDKACKAHDMCYGMCGLKAASRWLPSNYLNRCALICDERLFADWGNCAECGD